MIPFLVDVARLYEQFVAAWLQTHLPPPWHIRAQESVSVGRENELRFHIDLVLYDGNGRPHAVLDTKYKQDPRPKTADFNQIVTYAKIRGCRQAVLIYPVSLTPPLDVTVGGDLHVRALTFSLDADLDRAGRQFLDHLLPSP